MELMGFWGKIVIGVGPREKRGIRTQAMAQAIQLLFREDGLHVGADAVEVANDGKLVGFAAIGGRCG